MKKRLRMANRSIFLFFLRNQLRKKVISRLLFIRKEAVQIQTFMMWLGKTASWEMAELTAFFDKMFVQVAFFELLLTPTRAERLQQEQEDQDLDGRQPHAPAEVALTRQAQKLDRLAALETHELRRKEGPDV